MDDLSIIAVQPDSTELQSVMQLHKRSKATLGFLPDEGFTERAERGTLLGAVHDGRVAGYVIFDLTGDRVKIRYLCVDRAMRKHGIARGLIERVKAEHPERRGIVLDCRRDYGLSRMWTSLGFRVVGERPGRGKEALPLSIWELDFGHPTLFSESPIVGDLACLDQMILEDLVTERRAGAQSLHLREDWVVELIELCVTDEVFAESDATENDDLRRQLRTMAHGFRNLSRPDAPWEQHVRKVAELAPSAGAGDHRHVARAVEGGAVYFVTRDGELLRAGEAILEEFGILVVSPAGLLDRLDRQRAQDRYEPAVLEGTSLMEERLPAERLDTFVAALLNHGDGERAHVLEGTLRDAYVKPQVADVTVIRDGARQIVGGAVRARTGNRLTVTALRAGRVGALTDAVARQLVFLQRKLAADEGLRHIVVTDTAVSPAVRRALPTEFFSLENGLWTCSVERGVVEVATVLSAKATKHDVAAYERRHWPVKVVGAGVPTFMVSIEPSFAEQLIDADLAEATLFPRKASLGLSREQVYYRSAATWKNALAGPARILWYVKQNRGHPVGHVRAVSHLVEVVQDRPRTLHKRYARLGVWSQEKVEGNVDRRTGLAMALHVIDTERLAQPLSIDRLRELYAEAGERFQAPQGPVHVSERMFRLLYRESSAYA